ncbi:PLP-dependent cysteine synthase family protein [Clostridium taeniosporum]|uniref:cysteine synthase n=1 Tax=Clostridium taeniosporum TaxID=394958 RepID=A0A1D7XJC3_9CLOT|nr:PLP-dependent cysteine synthase family protein [Clostridium taeniosporum]AOR23432.1 cysteine synthase [Clostridium taeniosporum]
MNNVFNKINNLEKLIGNTPLVEISFNYNGKKLSIYSKLEYYNYTGSIKDRMALYILKRAYLNNMIKENYTIVETTSGNTGISFSAIGTYLGNSVDIYMPDWMSEERKKLLSSFNANLILVSKKDGGFLKCLELTEKRKSNSDTVFLPCQFSNNDNAKAHYLSTGPEIWTTLNNYNIIPTAFVAGVGTGGTIMGIGNYLKNKNPNVKIYPLEPSNSPTLSTGFQVNEHRIQGIVDEFIPPILNLKSLNEVISIDDGDAIIMAQKLSKSLGLGVGISSGANFLGAIKALELNQYKGNVVTIFADDNKKYLSTDLMKTEPIKDNFISSNIELIDFKTL